MLTAMASPVRIAIASVQHDPSGHWLVTWDVTNIAAEALLIQDAWVPHGQFRGEGHVALRMTLAPGDIASIPLKVTTGEAPGSIVRNAFLILRTSVGRVFARMRIEFLDTEPVPVIEAVTLQPLESDPDGALG